MALPLVRNPHRSGTPVVIGGVELITTQSEQTSGVDAPTKTLEKGSEINQRSVTKPESGTITGAVDASGLSGLHSLVQERTPISITTPEGTLSQCYVEEVSRTRDGRYVSKFGVRVNWRQIKLATLSTVSIEAVTNDGKKSQGSGSASPISLAGSNSQQSGSGGGGGGGGKSIGEVIGDALGF